MAETNLQIGNRGYRVQVPSGQEQRLQSVAARVDAALNQIREASGNTMDRDRLLVMSALTIADELHEAQMRQETERHTLVSFHANLAERLENVGRRLTKKD